jgi:hypothetical protein
MSQKTLFTDNEIFLSKGDSLISQNIPLSSPFAIMVFLNETKLYILIVSSNEEKLRIHASFFVLISIVDNI